MGLGPKGPRGLTESGIFERTSPFVLVPLLSLKHFSSALCRLSAYDCVRLCVCLCVLVCVFVCVCALVCVFVCEKPSCDLDQQILGEFYFVFFRENLFTNLRKNFAPFFRFAV